MEKNTLKVRLIQYNLIIVCVIALLFSGMTYQSVKNKTVDIAEHSLVNHVNEISYRYKTAYEEMMNIVINCTERGAFNLSLVGDMDTPEKRKKGIEYAAQANNFCAITGYGSYIDCMVIFNEQGPFIQASNSRGSANDAVFILTSSWFEEELIKSSDLYRLDLRKNPFFSKEGNFLPIARELYEGHSKQNGWVLLGISPNLFRDALLQADSGNEIIVATDRGQRIAVLREEQDHVAGNDKLIQEFTDAEQGSGVVRKKIHGKDSIIAYNKYHRSGIIMMEILYLDTLYDESVLIADGIILTFLICLSLGLLLSVYFTRKVEKPIKKLVDHIGNIGAGDFTIDPGLEREDEIGMIGKGINQMAEQISLLLHQKIEDEHEKSNLELQMLQAQINPHFLYNTLDSIKWIAVIQKNSGIVKAVTALSGLLKNMAKGFHEQVSLRKELQFLTDYVTIEKMKYVELFDLEILVEEETLYDAKVIKLTLQPLVENAIFSGIEPGGKNGIIRIHIYSVGDVLYLSVWDNGVGIPESKINKLLQDYDQLKGNQMSSIGLANVDRRIKLIYGEGFGISIESEVGKYTRITVKQPLLLSDKEEEN